MVAFNAVDRPRVSMIDSRVVIRFTGDRITRTASATPTTVTTASSTATASGRPLVAALIATRPASAANSPWVRLMTSLTAKIAVNPMAIRA
jgi:hypothetical protein